MNHFLKKNFLITAIICFLPHGDFISHIDHPVNRIYMKLKKLGIDKNTMVIFSSDNGGIWQEEDIQQYAHQSNWGRRGIKGDAWDGGHHVPLVIKWPIKIKEDPLESNNLFLFEPAIINELTLFLKEIVEKGHSKIKQSN